MPRCLLPEQFTPSLAASFEMAFNLFQCFAFRFRQKEQRRNEVNNGESGKQKEHGRIAVLAYYREENRRQCGGNHLIDH